MIFDTELIKIGDILRCISVPKDKKNYLTKNKKYKVIDDYFIYICIKDDSGKLIYISPHPYVYSKHFEIVKEENEE